MHGRIQGEEGLGVTTFQLKRDVIEVYPENKESVTGVWVNWETSFLLL